MEVKGVLREILGETFRIQGKPEGNLKERDRMAFKGKLKDIEEKHFGLHRNLKGNLMVFERKPLGFRNILKGF